MARLQDIEKIIDNYEEKLRKEKPLKAYSHSNNSLELESVPYNKTDLKSFIIDFFKDNHGYNPKPCFARTIQTREGKEETTSRGQRRTAGDIFRFALRYYSDDITLYDVMEILYDLVQNEYKFQTPNSNSDYATLYMNICSTIYRRVFNLSPGYKGKYKFDSSNQYYTDTSTSSIRNEFHIFGSDYTLLFDTKEGKELVSSKRNEIVIPANMTSEELDRLVMEKLKKLKSPIKLDKVGYF